MTKIFPIKITRQRLEDLNSHFLPYISKLLASRVKDAAGTKGAIGARVCLSVIDNMTLEFNKRQVNTTKATVAIKLKEYEALILLDMLLVCPVDPGQFWRLNSVNDLISQLHNQLI